MQNNNNWDTSYEWKAILLLTLAFGLVGMDRFVIGTLWNTIAGDLNLDPGAIGNLAGLTAFAWGIFAIVFGRLADRWGHRKIILSAVVLFSLTGGLTGMASGMTMFIVIRTLLGVMEGAYTPTSFAAVASAAKPSRLGALQGLQQSGISLLGLAMAPIIAAALLNAGFSWRMIFILIAAPGFIVAAFLWKVLKEPEDTQGAAARGIVKETGEISAGEFLMSYLKPFKSYNVPIATISLLGAMAGLFTLAAFMPVYLENVLGLAIAQMGIVTSAVGFGGFVGQFGWVALSDKVGRKPIAILGFAAAAISLYWFLQLDASAGVMGLFIPLFLTSLFCFGNIALITGPITTESAPKGLVGATIGVVVGLGEIIGGGMGPIVGSFVVPNLGLAGPLWVAFFGMILGFICSLFFKETAPIKVGAVTTGIQESGPMA